MVSRSDFQSTEDETLELIKIFEHQNRRRCAFRDSIPDLDIQYLRLTDHRVLKYFATKHGG